MRDGDYKWDASMTFEAKVTINGIEYDPLSWSLDREVTGIPGGTGSASHGASGEITLTAPLSMGGQSATVNPPGPSPWSEWAGFPPKKGDPVTVDVRPYYSRAADESVWFRRFTGIVDKASWSSQDGIYKLEVIDRIDRFTRSTDMLPMLAFTPPDPAHEGAGARIVDLQMATYVEHAMHVAGFDACIPTTSRTGLRIPLCGTLLPTFGMLTSGSVNQNQWASRYVADGWGYGMTDYSFYAAVQESTYNARFGSGTYDTDSAGDATMYLRIPKDNGGEWRIHPYDYFAEDGHPPIGFYVVVNADNSLHIYESGNETNSIDIPATAYEYGIWLMAYVSTGQLHIACRNEDGQDTHEFLNMPSQAGRYYTCTHHWTNSTTARPGGFLLAYGMPVAEGGDLEVLGHDDYLSWAPNATIPHSDYFSGMDVGRQIVDMKVSDLLDSICEAGVGHWGINEDGHAELIPLLKLAKQAYVLSLTDDTDVYENITWESDLLASACKVRTNLVIPQVQQSIHPTVQVWQGDSGTIASWNTDDRTINVPDDEDWISVDGLTGAYGGLYHVTRPVDVIYTGNKSNDDVQRVNKGWGSVFMATVRGWDTNGDATARLAKSDEYKVTEFYWNKGDRSIRLTQQAPKGGVDISTTAPPQNKWLIGWLWDKPTPILRAYAKVKWIDGWVESEDNGTDAPVFEHDVQWWAGDNNSIVTQDLHDLLDEGVVQFGQLDIRPDPRIQLADPIKLDVTISRLWVNGYISRLSESFTRDAGYEQKINLLTSGHQVKNPTYRDVEFVWNGDSYDEVEQHFSGETYVEVEADPLN